MKTLFLSGIILISATGCSTRNWYDGMRASHETTCLKVPEAEYQNCIKEADKSYDAYAKERQQLKKQPPR